MFRFRYLLFIILLVLGLILAWQFYQASRFAENGAQSNKQANLSPHFYQDSSRSLKVIRLRIFYVVPSNFFTQVPSGWHGQIQAIESDLLAFHKTQFHGSSELVLEVYPQPVILTRDNLFYDTENTNNGNPQGLRNIYAEIANRFPSLFNADKEDFFVAAFVYEGVGASGSDGAMIFSRSYLTNPEYAHYRATLFYHEFGHTIGLPDMYMIETNQPYSGDIMGAGRNKPINLSYVGPDLLAGLGIIIR